MRTIKHRKVLRGPNDLALSMWQTVCLEAPDRLFRFLFILQHFYMTVKFKFFLKNKILKRKFWVGLRNEIGKKRRFNFFKTKKKKWVPSYSLKLPQKLKQNQVGSNVFYYSLWWLRYRNKKVEGLVNLRVNHAQKEPKSWMVTTTNEDPIKVVVWLP